jgi:hypothetical protein
MWIDMINDFNTIPLFGKGELIENDRKGNNYAIQSGDR